MDTVKQALLLIVIGAAASPIWGALVWVLWQSSIRPRLIPRAEIGALAATMVARHGPGAVEVASAEEEQSWRNSRPFRARKMAAGAKADRAFGNIRKKMRTTRHRVVLETDRAIRGVRGVRGRGNNVRWPVAFRALRKIRRQSPWETAARLRPYESRAGRISRFSVELQRESARDVSR